MNRLEFIFGIDAGDGTALDHAMNSSRTFVRSQVQLALASDAATGRRLSAVEALMAFGLDVLEEVVDRGHAVLVDRPNEPAATFRKRRQRLKLSIKSLAAAADVSADEVRNAEMPGHVTPIHTLERIAQELALDERRIGASALGDAGADLATRLRELNSDTVRNDYFITALAEAAWIIHRQEELTKLLGIDAGARRRFASNDGNYQFPSYERGYELAARTRTILGLSTVEPVTSLHHVVTEVIGAPLIETDLGPGIAGATIISGSARGIALAADRMLPIARRMTLAHELGHFLWDPREKLESVRVEPAEIAIGGVRETDPVEIRANAFAITFLVPPAAVDAIWETHIHPRDMIAQISTDYGIHPTAAAHHLANIRKIDFSGLSYTKSVPPEVDARWKDREDVARPGRNLVRDSRSGHFMRLVMMAYDRKLITADTVRSWLRIDDSILAKLLETP